ncbi:MAG: response regulator [Pseudomonadota bacterium]|nr:response regulator [Pseudomonadota bacterium]
MKILAVDDSATMLEILANTLHEAGHAVVEASNGAEAIKCLSADIDIIISDLNMMVMSGFEFLKHVRDTESLMATPFIFLTTETDGDLKRTAREAGATAWIVKPFDPAALLTLVARFTPLN